MTEDTGDRKLLVLKVHVRAGVIVRREKVGEEIPPDGVYALYGPMGKAEPPLELPS